jgi:hypothetical protein
MSPRKTDDPAEPGGPDEQDPYALPEELEDAGEPPPKRKGRTTAGGAGEVSLDFGLAPPPPAPRRQVPKVAIVIAIVVAVAAGLLVYRSVSRKKALRAAIARAELDLRHDTADGYRQAAAILAPFAKDDPLEAASVRAFALSMLALDYREEPAVEDAEGLLVKPERAEPIPRWASLARAALALARSEAGTAMSAASRPAGDPVAATLQGRIALAAGNLEAALEPLHSAAAAEPALPIALALHGDVVRRSRREPRAAQAAYAAALAASGDHVHPRAAYGLAKLALAGQVPPAEASAPLEKLAADPGTPPAERARAALHAAALALKAGDRSRAASLLDGAGLDAKARDWAERAVAVEAEGGRWYRAVQGAPASLLSASDDDPPELPAVAPEPPPPPKPAPAPVKPKPAAKKPAKPAAKKGAGKRTK